MTRAAILGLFLAASGVAACSSPTSEGVATSGQSIVGGRETAVDAYPAAVALLWQGNEMCGGTLIAPSWILTAGHCIDSQFPLDVAVIGRHHLSSRDGEVIKIDRQIQHPSFNAPANDLALMHLATPSSIEPAQLVASADLAAIVPGADVTVVGWGNTDEQGSASDSLREVTVPIVAKQTCSQDYAPYDLAITDAMICAGLPQGTKDACQGDSGGPLFQSINGERVLVGVVSFGIGCARENLPGVYTRVSSYLGWINQTISAAP